MTHNISGDTIHFNTQGYPPLRVNHITDAQLIGPPTPNEVIVISSGHLLSSNPDAPVSRQVITLVPEDATALAEWIHRTIKPAPVVYSPVGTKGESTS